MKRLFKLLIVLTLVLSITMAGQVHAYDWGGSIYDVATIGDYTISEQVEFGELVRVGLTSVEPVRREIVSGILINVKSDRFTTFTYGKGTYTYYTKDAAESLGLVSKDRGEWAIDGAFYGVWENGDGSNGAEIFEFNMGEYYIDFSDESGKDELLYSTFKGYESTGDVLAWIEGGLADDEAFVYSDGEFIYYIPDVSSKFKPTGSLYKKKLNMTEEGIFEYSLGDSTLVVEGNYSYQMNDINGLYYSEVGSTELIKHSSGKKKLTLVIKLLYMTNISFIPIRMTERIM